MIRECAARVPGRRFAALVCLDLNERGVATVDREAVEVRRRCGGCSLRAGSAASASTTARSSRRRSGRRSSLRPRRSGCARSCSIPSGGRTGARAATCSRGCSAAATAGRSWSLARATTALAATSARAARASAAAARHRRRRPAGAVHRRGCPAPARLARAAARPERRGSSDPDGAEWQAEIEQAQAQLDELADMWAEQRDHAAASGRRPAPRSRSGSTLAKQAPRRAEPHDRADAAPRQRRRAARAVGGR